MALVTPITAKRELYSDVTRSIGLHPISGDVTRKTNEEAVKESIRNIVLTNKGERPFQPNFGCDIRNLLFENFNPQTSTIAEQNIRSAIIRYEPRAEVTSIRISPVSKNLSQKIAADQVLFTNTFSVTIQFYVVNNREPIDLEVVLKRVR